MLMSLIIVLATKKLLTLLLLDSLVHFEIGGIDTLLKSLESRLGKLLKRMMMVYTSLIMANNCLMVLML
jgi:hypothetical protein